MFFFEVDGHAVLRAHTRPAEPGANYYLYVPMDAGSNNDLYKTSAMRPAVSFRIKVKIGNTIYLPIEMSGNFSKMGQPGQRTRMDLTLGEDVDGDGIPDAWERALIEQNGRAKTIEEVRPGDDALPAPRRRRYGRRRGSRVTRT